MSKMNIMVEFVGPSRILSGTRRIPLNLDKNTSFREIVNILSAKYPGMIGHIINPEDNTLYASNMFNVNGKHMIRPDEMDKSPNEGDRLILMALLAGG